MRDNPPARATPVRLSVLGALIALLMSAALLQPQRVASAASTIGALPSSCPSLANNDYSNQTLVLCNFNRRNLAGVKFINAKLKGVSFVRANLIGADFTGATFLDSGNSVLPTDFSFARLDHAKFINAVFNGLTYFTYASMTCVDFSNTVLNNSNPVFGDSLLNATGQSCRAKFVGATMNCEFVSQWNQLDMTTANVSACAPQLQTVQGRPGHDFSGGNYSGVVFDQLNLTGSKWTGANLERASFQGATLDNATGLNGTTDGNGQAVTARLSAAKFNSASAQNVDFSGAQLYGANFASANLSGSKFAGAFLIANTAATPPIQDAANFNNAYLPNVNFTGAKLASAKFEHASFYTSNLGATPVFPCPTVCSGALSCGCAVATGADLTSASFTGAYLAGVDFSGSTRVNGTNFSSAILVGSSFSSVQFQVAGGAAPDFSGAMLQGVIFNSDAALNGAIFVDAFLDFGAGPSKGNQVYLNLTGDYLQFAGRSGSKRSTCVGAVYGSFSQVPATLIATCPDNFSGACGAGTPRPNPNPRWKGRTVLSANGGVFGWYQNDATYESKAPANAACNATNLDQTW